MSSMIIADQSYSHRWRSQKLDLRYWADEVHWSSLRFIEKQLFFSIFQMHLLTLKSRVLNASFINELVSYTRCQLSESSYGFYQQNVISAWKIKIGSLKKKIICLV